MQVPTFEPTIPIRSRPASWPTPPGGPSPSTHIATGWTPQRCRMGCALMLSDTVYVLQASDTVKLGTDHTIRVGLEYPTMPELVSPLVGGTIGYAVYSASGMWDWQITPALSFTNSVRIDYLALNYSGKVVPGSGLTNSDYNNSTHRAAQLQLGPGLQTDRTRHNPVDGRPWPASPQPRRLRPALLRASHRGRPASGSPDMQPTAVWNLELGYDHAIPTIGSTVTSQCLCSATATF